MSPVISTAAGVYALVGVLTWAAFALDKRAARLGGRRTPERTLHALSALGGWPGAAVAIVGLRHKNRKAGFVAVTALIALGHAAGWVLAWRWGWLDR